jgi:hypothetical protein
MTEMKKMFRGNKLEELWNSIWDKRREKINNFNYSIKHGKLEFIGQKYSEKRQEKNRIMKALDLKTGKQYCRYMKDLRRENKLKEAINNGKNY